MKSALGWVTLAVLTGCSSSREPSPPPEAEVDASPVGEVDAAPFVPKLPQLRNESGPILQNPKIVSITFGADGDSAADPWRGLIESFVDTIVTSKWWDVVRTGYCDSASPPHCVGQGTSSHVHVPEKAPTAVTDVPKSGTLRPMLQRFIDTGVAPVPDANTVYAIWFPQTTSISTSSYKSCDTFFAYHASFTANLPGGGTVEVPYVVMPRCGNVAGLTTAASHELLEAATDPISPDADALSGTSWRLDGNEAWIGESYGGEPADLCISGIGGDNYTYRDGDNLVQRIWSNAAAAAGHDPCVPAPDPKDKPFFVVVPDKDVVAMQVGVPTTIDLVGYSDAPIAADWAVAVRDVSWRYDGAPGGTATFALDKPTANAGTPLHLAVTLNSATKPGHPVYLQIHSQSGAQTHSWPLAIKSL